MLLARDGPLEYLGTHTLFAARYGHLANSAMRVVAWRLERSKGFPWFVNKAGLRSVHNVHAPHADLRRDRDMQGNMHGTTYVPGGRTTELRAGLERSPV